MLRLYLDLRGPDTAQEQSSPAVTLRETSGVSNEVATGIPAKGVE